MKKELDDRTASLLKKVAEQFWKEDAATRERQIRQWKRLKLYWDGFSRIWFDEVAHDWRIWDPDLAQNDSDQEYYDYSLNIFRAYLESIIAALSVLVPPIKCYPDDADNPLDLMTAKAGDKIAQLIARHNNVNMLWLQSLFIYCTEGMVAAYNYTDEDQKYGVYEVDKYEDEVEMREQKFCSLCQTMLADVTLMGQVKDKYDPDDDDVPLQLSVQEGQEFCPNCASLVDPEIRNEPILSTRLVGKTVKPKSRQCIEAYGGLYVKVPGYAKKQADCPYLFFSTEVHYTQARAEFPQIRNKILPNQGGSNTPYERWGRLNPQYQNEFPTDTVTVRKGWLRPSAFEALDEDEAKFLKKKFPNGAYVALVNDDLADYDNESLDDHWTLTYNPLADFLVHDPIGLLLTSVQDITNDLVSLTKQTIEHGIPQTMADPNVLNFDVYRQAEATPGAIIPVTPKSGRNLNESFYEVRTATLSPEVMPFGSQIQTLGQMIIGAQPSLFGGDIQGSKTASEYSMSRAQALQRLQNTWKLFTSWWKEINGKVIPAYIENVQADERFVDTDTKGNFINVFIRRAELEGKIGNIELEANENLPITWSQKRDAIMQLMTSPNQQLMGLLMAPENLPLLYEALGIPDLYIPGEDSRNKQYEEIRELLDSEPIPLPIEDEVLQAAEVSGMEPVQEYEPSVEVGEFDNHQVELDICITWINSEAGRLAKIENAAGYQNVLLHAKAHKNAIEMEMMKQAAMMPPEGDKGAAPPRRPKETDKEAPITGDGDVKTNE